MEENTKRHKREKPIRVVVEYVHQSLAKMVFVKHMNKLFVYATENQYIDTTMLPTDIPNRKRVKKALKTLRNKFNAGFKVEAIIYPPQDDDDDNAIFVNAELFVFIDNGKIVGLDALVEHPQVFVAHVVPVLSYKDIQSFELTKKDLRLMISNERNGVWKKLFARDFPELYAPDILPPLFLSDTNPVHNIMTEIESNGLCQFIDQISKPTPRVGTKNPKIRPYWKLLYEYHTYTSPSVRSQNNIKRFGMPKVMQLPKIDRTMDTKQFNLIDCCAFYKSKVVCMGSKEGLVFGKHFTEWESAPKIPNRKTFVQDVATDLFRGGGNIIPNTKILAFEQRLENTFISIWNPEKQKRIDRLFFNDQFLTKEDVHIGLIGEIGYFMQTDMETTVFINNQKKELFNNEYRFYACYNTPSNCIFAIHEQNNVFIWYQIDDDGNLNIFSQITLEQLDVVLPHYKYSYIDNIRMNLPFTLNDNYLVVSTSRYHIDIFRPNNKHCSIKTFNTITDMCIISNKLYLFSSTNSIVIVDLPKAFEISEKQDIPNVVKLSRNLDICGVHTLGREITFDYIRMTPMGFVLCSYNPTRAPIFLAPDISNFKLTACRICNLACQVCQIPSQYRCKTCKTPTCSGEHLKCCISK